jgi:phenylpyruvate tautomerase PptA (4-oxalocrotonate tautomerase family)
MIFWEHVKIEGSIYMPHMDIRISKTVDTKTREKLQSEIAGSMELIPGKNAANTLICISDNYTMYRDLQCIEAAFVDVRLYKESPAESKKAFAERLFVIFENVLNIEPSNVQINFVELPCWASGGNFF